jgi:hypothetical protein
MAAGGLRRADGAPDNILCVALERPTSVATKTVVVESAHGRVAEDFKLASGIWLGIARRQADLLRTLRGERPEHQDRRTDDGLSCLTGGLSLVG